MKKFKTESQKILDIMINSIYTNKEIFLRELVSNASDALDKLAYKSLTDGSGLDRGSLEIKISADKAARTLTISDNGIGMNAEELETNLGTIAKSGSEAFKNSLDNPNEVDIIGQFGVGFYSAFMVADKVTVLSQKEGETAHMWCSNGAAGYEISDAEKPDGRGTTIVLQLKQDTENDKFSQYLEEYTLRNLIKKYSDYIRYPIKLWSVKYNSSDDECDDEECECHHDHDGETSENAENGAEAAESAENSDEHKHDEKHEPKETWDWQTVNSMTPLWKKPKKDISQEEYDNFYQDNFYDYEKPLKTIHTSAEGAVDYKALVFIPSRTPFNYYNKNYEKGLKLYTNGVMIMEKCADLLPDCYGFVKGLVDAELTLNISRETIQQNRQLKLIAQNLEKKITSELLSMQQNDRENYEKFWEQFGLQIKFGVYENWGAKKEQLKDLLLFRSVNQNKLVSLKEYVEALAEGQENIYYVAGKSVDSVKLLPQVEKVLAKGYDVLLLTEDVDEFAVKVLDKYDEKSFKSVSDESVESSEDENADISAFIKGVLGESVSKVKCVKLGKHPVCLTTEGEISIEMEKVLNAQPGVGENKVSAQKVLEISTEHPVYQKLCNLLDTDKDKLSDAAKVLYQQARIIEGLPVDDPAALSDMVAKFIAE